MNAASIAQYDIDHTFTEHARSLIERGLYAQIAYQGRYVSINGSAGATFLQRVAHIDAVIQIAPDRILTVEEKIVRRKYDAFAIETHSNLELSLERGQPDGWIHVSTADRLLYAFRVPEGLEVYVMPLDELRAWFVPHEEQYAISDTPNGWGGRVIYHTRCRIVPIADVGCSKRIYDLRDGLG